MKSCQDLNSYNAIKEFEKAKKFVGEMLNAQSLAALEYTHYDANEGEWWGMPRNQWGIEVAPAPHIPYLFWPLAIVGALVFAHAVNCIWSRAK